MTEFKREQARIFAQILNVPAFPECLSHHALIDEIGRNGMAAVCWAHDRKLDRKVAIKAMPMPRDPASRHRLMDQINTVIGLNHPNMVRILKLVEFEGALFLVMDFVDGVILRLSWNFRSVSEILEMFMAAGNALAAAHEVGVVHRDFKPDNVMVCAGRRVVVLDFGLTHAELCTQPGPEHALDKPLTKLACMGGIVGTPAYMAPEQWLGAQVTASADQFSFCVALWEALHGQRPFAGTSAARLEQAVLSGSILEPKHATTRSRLREVLVRGLQTDPQRRFQSMHALLDALASAR